MRYYYNVFHKLWSVTPDSFDCLKDVHFAMLNDLLNTRIGGTVNTTSCLSIPESGKK
jgi:hypothetical protein